MNAKSVKKAIFRILSAMFSFAAFSAFALADGEETTTGSSLSMIIIFVVMIAVFYLFLIRPENKRKKQQQQMRDSLGVGDTITTIGGIIGKIVNVSNDYIVIETGEDRVRIQFAKWAVSSKGKATTEQQ